MLAKEQGKWNPTTTGERECIQIVRRYTKLLQRSLKEIERLYAGQPARNVQTNPTVRAIKRFLHL